MKIAAIQRSGESVYGRIEGDSFYPLINPQHPLEALANPIGLSQWGDPIALSQETTFNVPFPVSSIRDFITFEQHTAGSLRSVSANSEIPDAWFEAPAFYFTNPHAVVGTGAPVKMPPGSSLFDFEMEVAAVIGKDGYNLSVDEAFDSIVGFTIFNDWSARDLQRAEMRVGLGPAKGKDSASTLGPVVVSVDELESSRVGDRFDLQMEVRVNDRLIGTDSLKNMAWSFAELVSYASRGTWVKRGDVIGSGTSGGGCLAEFWGWSGEIGSPEPLKPGDVVTMSVESIGSIWNEVVESDPLHEVPPARRVDWHKPELL